MATDRDHSGAITLPPVIYGLFFAAGLVLEQLAPTDLLPPAARAVGGSILIATGGLIAFFAFRQFRKAQTTVHVHRATTALITEGPFGRSRNPLYVALTLLYAGLAVAANGGWMLILSPAAMLALNYGVIVREERYLERKFGDDYRRYRNRVRRWL
jgi:protein-S-isoprenylcysteine O-methyltransferase Ste14